MEKDEQIEKLRKELEKVPFAVMNSSALFITMHWIRDISVRKYSVMNCASTWILDL